MAETARLRFIRPTEITFIAIAGGAAAITESLAFLLARYSSLPWLLPVHFMNNGLPNGWQFKTYPRVLMPVFVQLALALTLGAIGALLLSRLHGARDSQAKDVKAASVAAEGVALIALVWVLFQAYAAVALSDMWQRERAGLSWYSYLELSGIALTIVITAATHLRVGRPEPRPFVAEHWRRGHFYRNPADPALFVPTRDGSRWTLNFGRPISGVLMGLILGIGIVAPTLILGLLLR